MVSVMTTHLPSTLVAHAGGKLCEHPAAAQAPYRPFGLVLRPEAKIHL